MPRSRYRNLIIIGNGFDCWQGIPTSYEQFRLYYAAHAQSVAEAMGCKLYSITDEAGNEKKLTAVELVYGDPFEHKPLANEFFWNLEARMNLLDDQIINLCFGRTKEGIEALRQAVNDAIRILKKVFSDWIATIDIDRKPSGFQFPDDCFVINFNYTDTVEKRFGIAKENVFHIHGSADDPDSIIVGHATHPEQPFDELIEHRFLQPIDPSAKASRFDGLYAVEEALYKTDKHTADQIDKLCVAFMERGVHVEDIENVYVLGHSFAKADQDYFEFIHAVTQCGCSFERISPAGHIDRALLAALMLGDEEQGMDLIMELIMLNLEYATHHRDRLIGKHIDLFPEMEAVDQQFGGQRPYRAEAAKEAVTQRFWFEQDKRTRDVLDQLAADRHVPVPDECHSILGYMDYVDWGHDPRKRNAQWHISYYSKDDQKRISQVMKELHNKRFTLYDSIDECIRIFRK